jgi:hypothetical protein
LRNAIFVAEISRGNSLASARQHAYSECDNNNCYNGLPFVACVAHPYQPRYDPPLRRIRLDSLSSSTRL